MVQTKKIVFNNSIKSIFFLLYIISIST